jgi:DNA-directed RNA polymerase subunit F
VSKFTKIEPAKAEELVVMLVKEYELDEVEAVQIINCMPETVDELTCISCRWTKNYRSPEAGENSFNS